MLVPTVSDGLERLLRATLPLPEEQGEVSFEQPGSTWSATVNRVTVNLFLFSVSRSGQPPRMQQPRRGPDGTIAERRFALPMVQLSYLVSAWAGSVRDEHALLGDVLTRLLAHPVVPAEHLPVPLSSAVQLTLGAEEQGGPRNVWSSIGGTLKASFVLHATVAADAYPWEAAPTGVAGIEPTTTRLPGNDAPSGVGVSGLRGRGGA